MSRIPILLLLAVSSWLAMAADAPVKDLRADIAKRLDIPAKDVMPSAVSGLYEVASGLEIGYVSVDGRYYIDGDVFEMATRENLTEGRRKQGRLAAMKQVQDGEAVVFAPTGKVRHDLTIFTDIDCGYCRQLHTEMAELNKHGVRVRYLAFPRSGPDTDSWRKAEAVWCSASRRDAMTRAKRGEDVKADKCVTPVSRQYKLARELGIRGTPGIITGDGDYLAGYMPAPRLLEYLDQGSSKAAE